MGDYNRPEIGQIVTDMRDNRMGIITAIPSRYSPFLRVRFDGNDETISLEYLKRGWVAA